MNQLRTLAQKFPAYAQIVAHYAESKELAFKRWRDSGYRDTAAHAEFIRYYEALTK